MTTHHAPTVGRHEEAARRLTVQAAAVLEGILSGARSFPLGDGGVNGLLSLAERDDLTDDELVDELRAAVGRVLAGDDDIDLSGLQTDRDTLEEIRATIADHVTSALAGFGGAIMVARAADLEGAGA